MKIFQQNKKVPTFNGYVREKRTDFQSPNASKLVFSRRTKIISTTKLCLANMKTG